MRTIKFRPLRVIKKSGKIAVASYAQWRSIKTSDYNNFNLIIDERYKMLNDEDFVYNHLGQQLFFYDFKPDEIIVNPEIPELDAFIPSQKSTEEYLNFRDKNPYILLDKGYYQTYWCRGLDCDGVPIFSHWDADYIVSDHTRDYTAFVPLTVGMVKMWFGWFLWQLDNSRLKVS